MIKSRFLIGFILFNCLGLIGSCGENVTEQSPDVPVMNAPANVQWLRLSQLNQLLGEMDYFSPLPIEQVVLDSLSISTFKMRIHSSDYPGYRIVRELIFSLKNSGLTSLAEQMYYNHILVDKRKFNYTSNNPYVAPFVLNQIKTPNPLIRQLFGFGNSVVDMLEVSQFQYEQIHDSLVVRKMVNQNFTNLETTDHYYFKRGAFVDTFEVGQLLHVGLPFDWNDVLIKVPFFSWVYTERHDFYANKQPRKSTLLQYGNTIQRTYLYDEKGRFERALDSAFFDNEFVRVSVLSSSYDSLSRPSSLRLYTLDAKGQEFLRRKVTFTW